MAVTTSESLPNGQVRIPALAVHLHGKLSMMNGTKPSTEILGPVWQSTAATLSAKVLHANITMCALMHDNDACSCTANTLMPCILTLPNASLDGCCAHCLAQLSMYYRSPQQGPHLLLSCHSTVSNTCAYPYLTAHMLADAGEHLLQEVAARQPCLSLMSEQLSWRLHQCGCQRSHSGRHEVGSVAVAAAGVCAAVNRRCLQSHSLADAK